MADLQFTWTDIEGLTDRLASVAPELSNSEWELLLAIFATAADKVESAPDKTSGTLPMAEVNDNVEKSSAELREQLRCAYVPGTPTPTPFSMKVTPPPPPNPALQPE